MRSARRMNPVAARMLAVLVAGLAVLGAGILWPDSGTLTLSGCLAGLVILLIYRLDYLHPAVAYLVPWLTILFFSTLPISEFARSLDLYTCGFLLITIFVWLAATAGAPVGGGAMPARVAAASATPGNSQRLRIGIVLSFVILYLFAAFNVAYAGYVPLLSLLRGDSSGYAEFGIPSIYGAFLAYSNATACVALYAYLREHRRSYLLLFLSVLAIHLAFVSRQNLVTLLAEGFVLRCLLGGRFSRLTIALSVVLALSGFSALGELRTGDIGTTIRVTPAYAWLPSSTLWLYAYSYFNVLNLQNMFAESGAPYYDGSMWQNLLPSVLRTDVDHGSFLEIEALNVSSYIYPIYLDVGAAGVIVWTAFWGLVTSHVYRRALLGGRFVDAATYACLYGCALLSFFYDFWFYLPVIFQLVFFRGFHLLLFRAPARERPSMPPQAAAAVGGD